MTVQPATIPMNRTATFQRAMLASFAVPMQFAFRKLKNI